MNKVCRSFDAVVNYNIDPKVLHAQINLAGKMVSAQMRTELQPGTRNVNFCLFLSRERIKFSDAKKEILNTGMRPADIAEICAFVEKYNLNTAVGNNKPFAFGDVLYALGSSIQIQHECSLTKKHLGEIAFHEYVIKFREADDIPFSDPRRMSLSFCGTPSHGYSSGSEYEGSYFLAVCS